MADFEYYKNYNCYALTISPKDRYKSYQELFNDDSVTIRRIKKCTYSYIIYPEITMGGRLHYHGMIRISNAIYWKKEVLWRLKKLGYVKLDSIKTFYDKLRWITYMSKEWYSTVETMYNGDHKMTPMMRTRKQQYLTYHEENEPEKVTIYDYMDE